MNTQEAQTAPKQEHGPICPNCGQWQHPDKAKGYHDCLNDCAEKGFAPKVDHSYKPTATQTPAHSPLPWSIKFVTPTVFGGNITDTDDNQVAMVTANGSNQLENARLIVASVNHADKLAEALRGMLNAFAWNADRTVETHAEGDGALQSDVRRARQALAAWEEANQ